MAARRTIDFSFIAFVPWFFCLVVSFLLFGKNAVWMVWLFLPFASGNRLRAATVLILFVSAMLMPYDVCIRFGPRMRLGILPVATSLSQIRERETGAQVENVDFVVSLQPGTFVPTRYALVICLGRHW